jgi:hypothetical protein
VNPLRRSFEIAIPLDFVAKLVMKCLRGLHILKHLCHDALPVRDISYRETFLTVYVLELSLDTWRWSECDFSLWDFK